MKTGSMKITLFFVLSILSLLQALPSEAGTYSYETEGSGFPNPDRGWYAYAPILGDARYADIGDRGGRLAYAAITLKDFVHEDISASVLSLISDRFDALRQSGVKAVLRVNYNEQESGTDATMDQMVRHMKQLQPLLADNRDVIAYIEAGYFGQWGEWHDWCGGQPNDDLNDDVCSKHPDNSTTWSRLMTELLQHVPDNRFVMIRYPGKKQAVFDARPVTDEDAYSSTGKARVGHHNDCFLASDDDRGTYQSFGIPSTVPLLKAYLNQETQYLPIGGETCSASSGHRFHCDDAVKEMEYLHWTYLNQDYYRGALDIWRDEGCLETIDRRLGYRLELLSATLPDTLIKGSTQTATFQIRNSGFSRAHYSRKAYLRLLQGGQVVSTLELDGVDIRRIGSGETLTVQGSFVVPRDIEARPLNVALWLPDEEERNWNNSRFSIRLAYRQNESDWARLNSPGHNLLARDIPVVAGDTVAPESPTGFRVAHLMRLSGQSLH